MDLITLYCVFSKGKHPKRIPSVKELLEVPTIPPKNKQAEEGKKIKNKEE